MFGLGFGAEGMGMNEAADSFRHLGTAGMRLWPFSHCLSTFFRSPHCLKLDLARKTLITELVNVSLRGSYGSAHQGVWEAGGWEQAPGQGNPPQEGCWCDLQWHASRASSPALQSLQGQHGCFKPMLHPATWSKAMWSFCCHFTCPSPGSQCKHRLWPSVIWLESGMVRQRKCHFGIKVVPELEELFQKAIEGCHDGKTSAWRTHPAEQAGEKIDHNVFRAQTRPRLPAKNKALHLTHCLHIN